MRVYSCCFYVFFFFKQKTAYEMRISDWSSDVCSSDLLALEIEIAADMEDERQGGRHRDAQPNLKDGAAKRLDAHRPHAARRRDAVGPGTGRVDDQRCRDLAAPGPRSEEHTSELQSLMRISYAVFCLKKKNRHKLCS